jgi:DNA-binding NarL/FixJ family response regulator
MVQADLNKLHERELEILTWTAKGLSNREIAEKVNISERTVQTHMANIFRKLRVASRTEPALCALRAGYITLDSLS